MIRRLRTWFGLIPALAGLFAILPGCSSPPLASNPPQAARGTNAPAISARNSFDVLRPGDRLLITFSDIPQPEKPFEETIAHDGMISLPFNVRISAAGKTKAQLSEEIRQVYVPKYYTRLTVTIRAEDRFFTVMGEVKNENRHLYLSDMTVLKAIAAAGGFSEFANKSSVEITRANKKVERVNAKKAQKNPSRYDVPIYPGDVIYVPRRVL